MVFIISVQTSNRWVIWSRSAPAMSAKLWPALNTGPLAARIAPVASLEPIALNASVTSNMTSSANALRFSGRLSVMVANGPSQSRITWW